jgi:hypothetical protein
MVDRVVTAFVGILVAKWIRHGNETTSSMTSIREIRPGKLFRIANNGASTIAPATDPAATASGLRGFVIAVRGHRKLDLLSWTLSWGNGFGIPWILEDGTKVGKGNGWWWIE